MNVDFNGYVDKFYSKEVYYFHNEEAIIRAVSDLVRGMKTDAEIDLEGHGSVTSQIFTAILMSLIQINAISLE